MTYTNCLQRTACFGCYHQHLTYFSFPLLLVLTDTAKPLREKSKVEFFRDQAQVVLAQYENVVHPESPARFGKLLLTMPSLKRISTADLEELFFKRIVGKVQIDKLMERL